MQVLNVLEVEKALNYANMTQIDFFANEKK